MAKKVHPSKSNAGPGCWQCADCGYIVSNDRSTCPRCEGEVAEEPDETDQSSLAGFGAGGQSKLSDNE